MSPKRSKDEIDPEPFKASPDGPKLGLFSSINTPGETLDN